MIYLLLLNGEYVPTINIQRAGHVIFVSNVQCKWLKSDYHHKVKPARWTTISKLNRFQRKNQIRSESRWFNVKLDLTVGPVDTVCIRNNSTNFMVSSWFTRPNMERNNHWIASTKWRYIVPSSDLKSAAVVVYYCVLEVLALSHRLLVRVGRAIRVSFFAHLPPKLMRTRDTFQAENHFD